MTVNKEQLAALRLVIAAAADNADRLPDPLHHLTVVQLMADDMQAEITAYEHWLDRMQPTDAEILEYAEKAEMFLPP